MEDLLRSLGNPAGESLLLLECTESKHWAGQPGWEKVVKGKDLGGMQEEENTGDSLDWTSVCWT